MLTRGVTRARHANLMLIQSYENVNYNNRKPFNYFTKEKNGEFKCKSHFLKDLKEITRRYIICIIHRQFFININYSHAVIMPSNSIKKFIFFKKSPINLQVQYSVYSFK